MSNCACDVDAGDAVERRTLWWVFAINATMFLVEGGAGLWADSSGLLADSLDMAFDAALYSVALYAIGRPHHWKTRATTLFGWSLLLLAAGVIIDALRRFVYGSEPESMIMILVSVLALAANVTCLMFLTRHRQGEVHMRAAYICSSNDVLANMGVIFSGGLVWFFSNRWPDLVVGLAIALIVLRGGLSILREAQQAGRAPEAKSLKTNCQDVSHD